MAFVYLFLRPAAVEVLEPPQRLRLWVAVFRRFFAWVNVAVALILLGGLARLHEVGGMAYAPLRWHAMLAAGLAMIAIYAWVRLVPYRALVRAVDAQDWKSGGAALGVIRRLVAVNLALGLATIAIATIGRWVF
jgi:uncharacterized membrane protein